MHHCNTCWGMFADLDRYIDHFKECLEANDDIEYHNPMVAITYDLPERNDIIILWLQLHMIYRKETMTLLQLVISMDQSYRPNLKLRMSKQKLLRPKRNEERPFTDDLLERNDDIVAISHVCGSIIWDELEDKAAELEVEEEPEAVEAEVTKTKVKRRKTI
ncbi:hypothetical protein QYF36_015264 [Acer negundo]|nr:hypothetical protein QYF36_015264 [Acer negundo]